MAVLFQGVTHVATWTPQVKLINCKVHVRPYRLFDPLQAITLNLNRFCYPKWDIMYNCLIVSDICSDGCTFIYCSNIPNTGERLTVQYLLFIFRIIQSRRALFELAISL
jgi:hypothetical protein